MYRSAKQSKSSEAVLYITRNCLLPERNLHYDLKALSGTSNNYSATGGKITCVDCGAKNHSFALTALPWKLREHTGLKTSTFSVICFSQRVFTAKLLIISVYDDFIPYNLLFESFSSLLASVILLFSKLNHNLKSKKICKAEESSWFVNKVVE